VISVTVHLAVGASASTAIFLRHLDPSRSIDKNLRQISIGQQIERIDRDRYSGLRSPRTAREQFSLFGG